MKVAAITRRAELRTEDENRLAAFLEGVNRTHAKYPRHLTVSQVFTRQAALMPEATAVVYRGCALTYRELAAYSDKIATVLRMAVQAPERAVGLLLNPSSSAVAAMLGTLKVGGAYVPLLPEFPKERVVELLRDCRAVALISDCSGLEKWGTFQAHCPDLTHVITVDESSHTVTCPQADDGEAVIPEDVSRTGSLAYVMYTSGTTGKPKGVLIEQQSILRLVLNTNWIHLTPEDRILQTGSLAFDASTFEIWGALLNGGTLVLADRDDLLNPASLTALIRRNGVNTIWLTTGLFNMLAANHLAVFEGLKTVIAGGERVSAYHFNRLQNAFPQIRLMNGYGPTENTTFTAVHEFCGHSEFDVPIGKPISNTSVYILDAELNPVPVGTTGELCTGGDGLARGYLNDPELTRRKFVLHSTFGRLYRTGDLARFRPDGCIEYLGRTDDQVKIRGYRIEPAEVETHLLTYPLVREAVVCASRDARGEYLVAYYISDSPIDIAELRAYMAERVPQYIVPAAFQRIDVIPLTPSGKVDRSALPHAPRAERDRVTSIPATRTEEALTAMWQEVLGTETIGIDDDFFSMGGDSLAAIKLTLLAKERLGVALTFSTIFSAPTIRQLGAVLVHATRFGVAAVDELLVCLTPDRNGPPVFAFPPGTADALSYAKLAGLLRDNTVHAFNFIEGQSSYERYADLISAVQDEGPYMLFGYSGGGNLAFRTAAVLEHRNREVSAVLMLDSSRFLLPFRFPSQEAARLAKEILADEHVKKYASTQVLQDKVVRRIGRYYDFLGGTPDNDRIAADIHLITAQQSEDEYRDEQDRVVCSKSAWQEATRRTFRVERGFGDHGHMLHSPSLQQNAVLISNCFRAYVAETREHA